MRYVLARPRLLSLTPSARSHHTRPQPARSHWTPFLSPYFPPALHVLTMRASPLLRRAAALECIAGRIFLGLTRLGCSRRAWDGPGEPHGDAFCNMYFVLSVCA